MPRYKGGLRGGPVISRAKAATNQADAKHKRVATTMRKTKPDGSREVMHRVEHHFDPIPYMKKLKRYPGSKDEEASRNAHEVVVHGGTGHRHGTSLEATLQQLRNYRRHQMSGALAGDGRLERPAPAHRQLSSAFFDENYGNSEPSVAGSAPPGWTYNSLARPAIERLLGPGASGVV